VQDGARKLRENLRRPRGIELSDPWIDEETDVDGLVHDRMVRAARSGTNDNISIFYANMTSPPRRSETVALVVYPGVQILDVTGPAAAFALANRCLAREHYRVEIVSATGGAIASSSAVTIATRSLRSLSPRGIDTLLVTGGEDASVRDAMTDPALRRWIVSAAARARRYGSVCSGAFVLASCGLLDGRRAATHWDGCALLRERFPAVEVDSESLYVVDGPVWTSAGVTTGVDMVLAMIERDLSAALAGEVAQRLVVYARRPGHQSQFSAVLRAQVRADAPYAELVEWIDGHLGRDLGVEALARRAAQSPRDFHRKFTRATGQTPARFVENVRLDRVRMLLSHPVALKDIADQTGFRSVIRMSRAFERRFGVRPTMFRQMLPRSGVSVM
jgi:transcriptional regulator GlxA family with amidase domain